MTLAERLAGINGRIARAAEESGRRREDILLVGACKTMPPEVVREAALAGIDAFGENRVQELMGNWEAGAYEDRPLHFIGTLQKNKVRQIVGKVALIQSVDSIGLLEEIQKQAEKRDLVQPVLIEVNIGDEESKSGIRPEDLWDFLAAAEGFSAVEIQGLMAIPPVSADEAENRAYFAAMRQLFVDMKEKTYDNVSVRYLSMGMSGDFEDAIREGANLVRVGTAIFGSRA